ncbi:Rrf2 family transcriptional regulator [Escherichia coli]|nr:Rrf2 family transcriptional regulator [Escherichia coli]
MMKDNSGSQRASVAVMVMIKFVKQYTGKPISLRQLSKETVSLSYLEQIFRYLRESSLVKATRGPGGGYIPTKENYSVGDIVRAMKCSGLYTQHVILAALDKISLTSLQEDTNYQLSAIE